MKTADFLRQHNACPSGAKWALSISDDMSDVWEAMITHDKHGWLIWTATRPGVFSDTVARKLACRFVRETPLSDGRNVWDLLTDERSRMAVAVAERYAEGKATKKELADAANAASDAASDVADAADAAYAEIAAYAAADAAALAAYDAASAAARAATWAACAAYVTYNAYNATDAAARAASAAAARAADGASASAARAAADADARAAQVRMFAELGNPFKEGNDHENR